MRQSIIVVLLITQCEHGATGRLKSEAIYELAGVIPEKAEKEGMTKEQRQGF